MQEIQKFKFLKPLEVGINNAYLQKTILSEIYEMDFRIFLSPYFKKNGGVVEGIEDIMNFFLNDNRGTFQVIVKVNTYNACLAIDAYDKEILDISFKIDDSLTFIEMTGPLWLEREPDDI